MDLAPDLKILDRVIGNANLGENAGGGRKPGSDNCPNQGRSKSAPDEGAKGNASCRDGRARVGGNCLVTVVLWCSAQCSSALKTRRVDTAAPEEIYLVASHILNTGDGVSDYGNVFGNLRGQIIPSEPLVTELRCKVSRAFD